VAQEPPPKKNRPAQSTAPIREHVSFVYQRIEWRADDGAPPVTASGVARLLRAPGADPAARRGSFEVFVSKGPLQEFFARVAQYAESDWQFLSARLACVDPEGRRHDLGTHRLGFVSYEERANGATTEQFFPALITEVTLPALAACLSSADGP
jgi:hypothetical protein